MATDQRIYEIAVAYILKGVLGRTEWPFTTIGKPHPSLVGKLGLAAGESVLASAFFSDTSWYAFTTRRIVSRFRGELQSLDPSQRIQADFGNFKGYDFNADWDENQAPDHTAIPVAVATVTSEETGQVLRFEFETWEAFAIPSGAIRYWTVKHPIVDKLMTPAEREHYKKRVALPRSPRGRPVKPAEEQARELAKWHAHGVISASELFAALLGRATPSTLPRFMAELAPELHRHLREVILPDCGKYRTVENGAVLEAIIQWYRGPGRGG